MSIGYLWSVIFNPIKTFEKIKKENPDFIDSFLIFAFIHLLLLGASYILFSSINDYYGFRDFFSIFISLPIIIFLREPNFSNICLSFALAFFDLLLFTGIIQLFHRKSESKGNYSSLFMMFSLTQIVQLVSIIALIPIQKNLYNSSMIFMPLLSILGGLFLWKLGLYFVAIRVNYETKPEKTFLILIASYIIFSIFSIFVISYFFKSNPIVYAVKTLSSEVSVIN